MATQRSMNVTYIDARDSQLEVCIKNFNWERPLVYIFGAIIEPHTSSNGTLITGSESDVSGGLPFPAPIGSPNDSDQDEDEDEPTTGNVPSTLPDSIVYHGDTIPKTSLNETQDAHPGNNVYQETQTTVKTAGDQTDPTNDRMASLSLPSDRSDTYCKYVEDPANGSMFEKEIDCEDARNTSMSLVGIECDVATDTHMGVKATEGEDSTNASMLVKEIQRKASQPDDKYGNNA